MRWIQITPGELHHGQGVARQVGLSLGEVGFIYFLKREGSKDDSEVPRVVSGLGKTHADAMTAVIENVAAWDRAARVVWADDARHPAQTGV